MASGVLFYGEGERLRQRLLAKEPALPFSFWVCRFRDSPALFPDPQVALLGDSQAGRGHPGLAVEAGVGYLPRRCWLEGGRANSGFSLRELGCP